MHYAVASHGDWPNVAICRAAQRKRGKRVPLTRKLTNVTCPECHTAIREAFSAARFRHALP